MRRRLASALACVAATAAATMGIAHCSATTELVVVVDTDLAVGTEVDEIDVTVSDGAGFETHRSARVGPGGTSLPLTLGVTAGGDANKSVTVRAIARLRGADVTSASLRTGFVEGESKLAHVSICRSCGAACATVDLGSERLASWTGAPPSRHACSALADEEAGATDAAVDGPVDADAGALVPGLIAWWRFEEEGGLEVVDHSGSGNGATFLVNGRRTTDGGGHPGEGAQFQRLSNERLDCRVPFGERGALAFFFRDLDDDATLDSGSAGLFSNQTTGRNHFFLYRFFGDGAAQQWRLMFQRANEAGAQVFAVNELVQIQKDAWTPIVVSWSPSSVRYRIGATPVTTTVEFVGGEFRPTDQTCFFGERVKGVIDNVRFYSRELGDDEMAALLDRPPE